SGECPTLQKRAGAQDGRLRLGMVAVLARGGTIAGLVPPGAAGVCVPDAAPAPECPGAGGQRAYSAHAEVAGPDERTDSSGAERYRGGQRIGDRGRDPGG